MHIQPDEPVNMSLSGISLRSALKIILEPLALTYVIQDEVMRITTETKAEELAQHEVRESPFGKHVPGWAQPGIWADALLATMLLIIALVMW